MTVGQRIFYLLEEKKMTQVEFSKRTGIATTTISDWRKKNTNPGSEKIMQICAALEVTPEYLLSGVCEDSDRGKAVDYMVIPQGTELRNSVTLRSIWMKNSQAVLLLMSTIWTMMYRAVSIWNRG